MPIAWVIYQHVPAQSGRLVPARCLGCGPELVWARHGICQPIVTLFLVLLVPAVEGAARYVQLIQCSGDWEVRVLHQVDNLHLLRL